MKLEAKMTLALSIAMMLYACSAISLNLTIYSFMGSSDCFSWISLCFAIVALPHSKKLSWRYTFIGNQLNPLDTSSLMYFSRFPLEIAYATSIGFLLQIATSQETSSSQMPNSCRFLPSQALALLRKCSLEAVYDCLNISCRTAYWLVMDLFKTSMTSTRLPAGGDIA